MVIEPKTLLKLVKKEKLVENLSERELENPEGAGFDLRLGSVYKISGKAFLGVTERNTPKAKRIAAYKKGRKDKFILRPGQQVLVSTIETVNIPKDITANFWLRGTLYRSGVILSGGNIAPGYSGILTFSLYNAGKSTVEIEMGARIIHILFFKLGGKGSHYRGQWQGGRVAATKREKQV